MNLSLPSSLTAPSTRSTRSTRAVRAAAGSALAVAVLSLGLTGCGDSTGAAAADQASVSSTPGSEPSSTPSSEPSSTPTSEPSSTAVPSLEAEPEPEPASTPSAAPAAADLLPADDQDRVPFPGDWAVLDDGSSATSNGEYLFVSTAAEEKFSVQLPISAEGWISSVLVDLGDAGVGYLVTQSGGETLLTSLAVLKAGELFLAEPSDEVPFGDSVDAEGETWTTGNGAHLYTRVGDDTYEWSVQGTQLVPTPVAAS